MRVIKILKLIYSILFILFLLNASLIAQKTLSTSKDSNRPVMLFKKAQSLISQNKPLEAKKILGSLLQKFPYDFEIREQYLSIIAKNESDEVYDKEATEALAFYNKIPIAERTENFYKRYQVILRDLNRLNEMLLLKDEIVQKFPRSDLSARVRVMEVLKEKNVVKASELFESIISDFKNNGYVYELYQIYFPMIFKNHSRFDKQKIISVASKYEQSKFDALNKEAKINSSKVSQYSYLKTVLELSDKLRNKFPKESLRYAQKGLSFFEKMKTVEKVAFFKVLFNQSALRSYLALEDWSNAQKTALKIIDWTQNSAPIKDVDEARLHRDLALALENLNQISLAREHNYFALLMSEEFQKDWKEFNIKHPLSPTAQANFEKTTKAKFQNTLDSRDALVKAAILKTEQNIMAKDFRIEDLKGKTVSLNDYKGKVLILNFWATWCQPCVGELELMKTAYKKYADNPNISFAFISTDKNKEKVPATAKKRGYTFPIFYSNKKLETDYETNPIPRMVIIDKKGKIRFSIRGFNNNGYYLKKLDWMIETAMK